MYVLIDPRNGEVIYVGKGTNNRMYDHWKNMLLDSPGNQKLHNKLTAIFRLGYESPIYDKLFQTNDEQLAYAMEVFWIAVIGRKNLCNLTDGGEGGPVGNKYAAGQKLSEERKEALRAFNKGKKHALGTKRTEEQRRKISEALSGEKSPNFGKRGKDSPLFGRKQPEHLKQQWSTVRSGKITKANTSGYVGVSYNKKAQKWMATIRVRQRLLYLGLFATDMEAAKAYNARALELRGPNARLNAIP